MRAKNIAGMTVKDFIKLTKQNIDTKKIFDKYYNDNINAVKWSNAILEQYGYEDNKIPFAFKDNMYIKNKVKTSGSKMLENFKSPFNSTVYELAIKNNLNVCCSTNMDEFAMGSHNIYSAFGYVHNPINLNLSQLDLNNLPSKDEELSPGGSTGGSAVVVSMGLCLGSFGTDTGGSVRGPAEWNGLVAIKPTFGNISRYGVVELSSSLDTVSIFAKTIECLKYFVDIFYKEDDKDSVNQLTLIKTPLKRKLASLKSLAKNIITKESYDALLDVEEKLKAQGYIIEDIHINMDLIKAIDLLYTIICYSDAGSSLRVYNSLFYNTPISSQAADIYAQMYNECRTNGMGLAQAKRRMMIGSMLSTSAYKSYINKAWQVVSLLYTELKQIFNQYDGIITPVNGNCPKLYNLGGAGENGALTSDIWLCLANLCGIPAVSIPVKYDKNGIYGVQIMADIGMDMQILDIAQDIDNIYKFNEKFRGNFEIIGDK